MRIAMPRLHRLKVPYFDAPFTFTQAMQRCQRGTYRVISRERHRAGFADPRCGEFGIVRYVPVDKPVRHRQARWLYQVQQPWNF